MKKIPVYTEEDEARFNAVLKEIQSRIPAGLKNAAVSIKKLTPTIEMVMQKALESDLISEEKKEQVRHLLDSGQVSKAVPTENSQITKQIDNFVARETNKAIKEGRLPPRSHIKYLPSVIKANEEKKN